MCFAVLCLRFANVVHSLVFRSGLRYVIGVRFCFPLFWRDWQEGSLLFVMHPALCSMSLVWFVNIL